MRFFAVVLLAAGTGVAAQSPASNTWWGFISLGPGGAADSGFYASGVGVAIARGNKLYMGRVASLDTPKDKRITDAGLLVGVARRPERVQIAVAAGVGVATDSRDSTALAMPLEAQVSWLFTRRVALGARVFGSINRLENFGGLGLTLQFGRLRR